MAYEGGDGDDERGEAGERSWARAAAKGRADISLIR